MMLTSIIVNQYCKKQRSQSIWNDRIQVTLRKHLVLDQAFLSDLDFSCQRLHLNAIWNQIKLEAQFIYPTPNSFFKENEKENKFSSSLLLLITIRERFHRQERYIRLKQLFIFYLFFPSSFICATWFFFFPFFLVAKLNKGLRYITKKPCYIHKATRKHEAAICLPICKPRPNNL